MEIYDSEGKFIKKAQTGGRKGVNIVSIPLNMDPPRVPKSPVLLGAAAIGPSMKEGSYKIKIVKGKESFEDEMILAKLTAAQTELEAAKSKRAKKKAQEQVDYYAGIREGISATQAGESGIPGQVRLREKIAEVYGAVTSYDGAPTNLQVKALDLYQGEIDALKDMKH